jgi:hypothetical protein
MPWETELTINVGRHLHDRVDLTGGVRYGGRVHEHVDALAVLVGHDLLMRAHAAVVEGRGHGAGDAGLGAMLVDLVAILADPGPERTVVLAVRLDDLEVPVLDGDIARGLFEQREILPLEAFDLGDIGGDLDDGLDLTLRIADRRRVHYNVGFVALPEPYDLLTGVRAPVHEGLLDGAFEALFAAPLVRLVAVRAGLDVEVPPVHLIGGDETVARVLNGHVTGQSLEQPAIELFHPLYLVAPNAQNLPDVAQQPLGIDRLVHVAFRRRLRGPLVNELSHLRPAGDYADGHLAERRVIAEKDEDFHAALAGHRQV